MTVFSSRSLLLGAVLATVVVPGAQAAERTVVAPPLRVSPASAEGQAIVAKIKKLDRSIRFQQRMANERATRLTGADTDRYIYFRPSYGYGYGYGFGAGYGADYRGAYTASGSLAYYAGLGEVVYLPQILSSPPASSRGTVKYRRLVAERAALQAQLAPF